MRFELVNGLLHAFLDDGRDITEELLKKALDASLELDAVQGPLINIRFEPSLIVEDLQLSDLVAGIAQMSGVTREACENVMRELGGRKREEAEKVPGTFNWDPNFSLT